MFKESGRSIVPQLGLPKGFLLFIKELVPVPRLSVGPRVLGMVLGRVLPQGFPQGFKLSLPSFLPGFWDVAQGSGLGSGRVLGGSGLRGLCVRFCGRFWARFWAVLGSLLGGSGLA